MWCLGSFVSLDLVLERAKNTNILFLVGHIYKYIFSERLEKRYTMDFVSIFKKMKLCDLDLDLGRAITKKEKRIRLCNEHLNL